MKTIEIIALSVILLVGIIFSVRDQLRTHAEIEALLKKKESYPFKKLSKKALFYHICFYVILLALSGALFISQLLELQGMK